MKKLCLLCNAHLDPVWLWQRQEGVAEAISTFRVAAKFCEEYDGFVFNHNESLLYEWVEEHEPALFEKIKKLVKEGKWHIMGGWYLQPDCMIPSGESFIRQIEVGNSYFMEKFGVKPTTAINFDPFGHSRGLVQILKKTGYDSYVFMRPYDIVPERDFIWKGYDGSEIIGHNTNGGYNTNKGKIVKRLDSAIETSYSDTDLMLWGIGNHGGGPSKVDLDAIEAYKKEHPELEIVHSYCEEYFSQVDRSELRTVAESMQHCMVGCYTSMVRIKQMHRQMENELAICEKMIATAGITADEAQLAEAEKAMLFCEFHDVLPGSLIRPAEEDSLRLMGYGRESIDRFRTKAFFKMCEGQKEGKAGEIPVLVYNPNPYPVTETVEVEFQLEDQNWTPNETTLIRVRTEDGKYLPAQNEQEASSIPLDWRKRVAFCATLKPMSINRFDCELYKVASDKRPIADCDETATHFVFENNRMKVTVNKQTGLLDCYNVDGIDYIKENSAKIIAYQDNADPWGMTVDGFYDVVGAFSAVSAEEANRMNGYPQESFENVRVVENGDVRLKIQAILKHENSFAIVTYSIAKLDAYVDIKIKMLSNDADRLYKLSFETPFADAKFLGQSVFGREDMLKDEKEITFQKWCGMFAGDKGLVVLNRGTYAGSAKDGRMNLTLLRTPAYSAHPIEERAFTTPDRNHDRIDLGEREFEYRLTADITCPDADAEIYNQPMYALSFFPSGAGEKKDTTVMLDNKKVILSRYKKRADGKVLVRVYHPDSGMEKATLTVSENQFLLELSDFEVKTFLIDGNKIEESSMTGF